MFDSSDFEGKHAADRKSDKLCRKCKKKGFVKYIGSDVDHGNIFTPAADTEVTHYYMCTNCSHEWEEYA